MSNEIVQRALGAGKKNLKEDTYKQIVRPGEKKGKDKDKDKDKDKEGADLEKAKSPLEKCVLLSPVTCHMSPRSCGQNSL